MDLNFAFALILTMALFFVPFYTAYFIKQNFIKLTDKIFIEKFGTLYINIKAENKMNLIYPIYYFLRRLLVAFILVISTSSILKVFTLITTSLFMIYYLAKYRPF